MAKFDYMLSIVWFLRSRRRMTAEQLAEVLEISVRTVYRHIEALNESGVPVVSVSGPGGGYELSGTFESTPLFFETTELQAMAHGALLARQAGYPYAGPLDTALEKIENRLNERQIKKLEQRAARFRVPGATAASSTLPVPRELPADFVRKWFARPSKAQGEPAIIRLLAEEEILDSICSQWFLRFCPVERGDGEARLNVNQEQMLALMPSLLMSYGTSVTVLEPEILRQKLAQQARQLAQFYESATHS